MKPLHYFISIILCVLFADPSTSDNTPIYLTLDELDEFKEIPAGTSSLVFVFDVTGSMYHDLLQVIDGAEKIVETIVNLNEKFIYNYVLIPFHDPVVGPITQTTNSTLFLTELRNLTVKGGGDCPEMSITAIKQAVEVSLPKSLIYVFTDASSKDFAKLHQVLSLIQKKESQVVFVLTGDCKDRLRPGYQAYEKIASTSSGQIFHLDKQDVEEVLNFVRTTLETRKVNLLAQDLETTGNISLDLTVDQNLEQFTLSVSGKNPQIRLVDPDGIESNESTHSTVLKLPNIEVVKVTNPSPGKWKVVVTSESPYSLRFFGLSLLDFAHGFSLNPTENLFETYHRPLKGTKNYLLVNSTEPSFGKLIKVELVDLTGKILDEVELSRVNGSKGLYNGSLTNPPSDFFYLKYHGINEDGYPFQRLSSTAISAVQPVAPDVAIESKLRVYFNQPITIRCKIYSLLPFRVAWFRGKGGRNQITNYFQFNQSNEILYSVPRALPEDKDWYFCKSSNVAGSSKKSIFLDLKNPPPLISKPLNVTAVLGHNIELKCLVTSSSSFNMSWNRLEFHSSKNKKFVLIPLQHEPRAFNMNNGSVWIYDVQKEDEGWYRCSAISEDGTTHQILYTEVKEKLYVDKSATNLAPFVIEGSNLSLKCSVSGSLPITWYKDAKWKSDSDVLDLKNISTADEGLYYCVAKNNFGELDVVYNVTVLSEPRLNGSDIVTKIKSNENEQTLLQCEASGKPIPDFKWFKDGEEIESTDSTKFVKTFRFKSDLVIDNTQLFDEGRYTCEATNPIGVSKKEFQLQVLVPPHFPNLEDLDFKKIVILQHSIVINCSVRGTPSVTVLWEKDGHPLTLNNRTNISSDGQLLHVQNATSDDKGIYSCIATNEAGVLNTSFSVEILAPLQFLNEEENIVDLYGKIDDEIELDCTLKTTAYEPVIVWLKQNQAILVDEKYSFTPDEQKLYIRNLSIADDDHYTCIAYNPTGIIEKNYWLHVTIPSKIIEKLPSGNIIKTSINDTSVLECLIDGKPYPTISWFKDGKQIYIGESIYENGVIKGNRIQFEATQMKDAGNFTCVAENSAGKAEKTLQLITLVPPKIQIIPDKKIVNLNLNESFNIHCNAIGNPVPEITWLKDGMLLDHYTKNHLNTRFNVSDGVLFINTATLNHSGTYLCIAYNDAGISEKEITLNVLLKPVMKNDDSVSVLHGLASRPQTLECFVDAFPKAELTWFKNDVPINDHKNGLIQIRNNGQILHFLRPQGSDSGNYTCNATNAAGSSFISYLLDIWVLPSIKVDPFSSNSYELSEGKSVIFECNVEGNPIPKVHWTKDGKILDDESASHISIKNNNQLVEISEIKVNDSGDYFCHATSVAGNSQRVFQLSVYVPPVITKFPLNETFVLVDGAITFECLAKGIPTPLITWFKNSQPITSIVNHNSHQISDNGRYFHIQRAVKNDDGRYTCLAANIAGSDERSFVLIVNVPAVIDDPVSSSFSVLETKFATLECRASGTPKPSISWLKNGEIVDSKLNHRIKFSDESRKLHFTSTLKHDAGLYQCFAYNDFGSDTKDIVLQVLYPPFLSNFTFNNVIVKTSGENVTLQCPIDAFPKPFKTWYKNEQILPSISNEDHSLLQLENVQSSDAGDYKCTAKNTFGELQIEMELHVLTSPKIITHVKHVNATVGQPITIECIAEGNPIPTVSWYRRGQALISDDELSEWFSEIYDDFDNDFSEHNDDKPNSDDFQKNLPTIPSEITNNWKYKGQVPVVNNFETVMHEFSNQDYVPSTFEEIVVVHSEHILHIENASTDLDGIYTCHAVNDVGEAYEDFKLSVLVPPTINTSYTSLIQTIEVNNDVKMECLVSGTQPIRISWFKNFELLAKDPHIQFIENDQILVINHAKVSHSGVYRCSAENAAGKADSDDMTVTIIVLPQVLTIRLKGNSLPVHNESVTLECVTDGIPSPELIWLKDSENIPEDSNIIVKNEELKIIQSTSYEAGVYSCIAINDYGFDEGFYHLEIFESPTIKNTFKTNSNVTALLSDTLTLECPLQGIPRPTIEWHKRSKPITPNGKIELLNYGYQLWISSVEVVDKGDYTCEAKNAVGMGEYTFHVDVLAPPSFDFNKDEVVVLVNHEMELFCTSFGIPLPTVSWSRNTANSFIAGGRGSSRFRVARTEIDDGGVYVCTANNSVGIAEKIYEVNVYEVPKIKASTTVEVVELLTGQEMTLNCQATGTPVPRISWYKSGQIILPEFNSNPRLFWSEEKLKIVNVQVSDSESYSCTAKNPVGSATKKFKVVVSDTPKIEVQQGVIRAFEGSSIILKCYVSGWPTPNVQWIKANYTLSSGRFFVQNDNHLKIEPLYTTDEGDYTCVARNRAGIAKRQTNLLIFSYPRIQSINNDVKFINGLEGVLNCNVSGNPVPTVKWLKENDLLLNTSDREIHLSGAVYFSKVHPHDSGNYTCVAENDIGKANFTIHVNVLIIPAVEIKSSAKNSVVKGDDFNISCKILEGSPPPILFLQHNAVNLTSSTKIVEKENEISLHFENVNFSHAGVYQCVAENEVGLALDETNIAVYAIPAIDRTQKENINVVEGQLAHLKCKAQGFPTPTITWIHENEEIEAYYNPRINITNSGDLLISYSKFEDSGKYICVAKNLAGQDEAEFSLEIYTSPSITLLPDDQEVEMGQNVSFKCAADGYPYPNIEWTHNGILLPTSDILTSIIEIRNVSKTDGGQYQCTAINKAGSQSAIATLVIKSPQVTYQNNNRFKEFSSNEAMLECTLDENDIPKILWLEKYEDIDDVNHSISLYDEEYNIYVVPMNAIDEGQCIIRNAFSSQQVKSTVIPKFVIQPEDVVSQLDGVVVFNCTAKGIPSPSIQWYKQKMKIGPNDRFKILQNNTLIIENIKVEDQGKYSCVASNQMGSVLVDANLKIDDYYQWSEWSGWSICSVSCGGGSQQRIRKCKTVGKCVGPDVDTKTCNDIKCPVHGNWSIWTDWGACSSTCGTGNRKRVRKCNNPSPQYGGRSCVGTSFQTESCHVANCEEIGKWSSWSDWSECTVTCGVGTHSRLRRCIANGAKKKCVGKNTEIKHCQKQPCFEKDVIGLPTTSSGKIVGIVNGLELDKSNITVTFNDQKIDRIFKATVHNLRPDRADWFQILMPIISPFYWVSGKENNGTSNGFTLTEGYFTRATEVMFTTGEVLKMTHVGRGIDKSGALRMDIVLNGDIPQLPDYKQIKVEPYEENYTQTSPDSLHGKSTTSFRVNGYMLQYIWNHTTSYDAIRGTMPNLVQNLLVENIHVAYDKAKQQLIYSLSTKVQKELNSECPIGFRTTPFNVYCLDDNECLDDTLCEHECLNSPGSYSCSCQLGYILNSDGYSCDDLNECALSGSICPWGKVCKNIPGSFECVEMCDVGYQISLDGKKCEDINECLTSQQHCYQNCINTVGSFRCSCDSGFRLINGGICIDVDECAEFLHNCVEDEECINTDGSYYCKRFCASGFTPLINGSCVDENECADNPCPSDKICLNTQGSFRCVCRSGFESNEISDICTDIDECNRDECQHGCENTYGSFNCNCPQGYEVDANGKSCVDINECDGVVCPNGHLCFNGRGSFQCIPTQCPSKYTYDETSGFCVFDCDENDIKCPPNIKYTKAITHKMIALPSGVEAFKEIVELVAFDKKGKNLSHTTYSIVDIANLPFRIRLDSGRGILYSIESLNGEQNYKVIVHSHSYDSSDLLMQYSTQFVLHISVSRYSY